MSNTCYRVQWDPDYMGCIIYEAVGNRYVMRAQRETPEERLKRKALEERSTPQQNLARILRQNFESQWKAAELYPWFEANCPGYYARKNGLGNHISITFANKDHAMLFKLTWT